MTLWFFAGAAVVLVVCLFRPFNPANGTFFCRLVTPMARRIMGLKIIVRHPERLSESQPCIYLCNHQHLIDLFVFGYLFPARTVTMGKKSIRWVPIFGWAYWLSHHFLIDRSSRNQAAATLRQVRRALLEKKISVLITPEGTRSRRKGLGKFKKGAFYLAVKTGLPLQPLVASSYYKNLNGWRWRTGTILIEALPPIPTKSEKTSSIDGLMAQTHEQMRLAIDRLDIELVNSQ